MNTEKNNQLTNTLDLTINHVKHAWNQQYISGLQVRQMGAIPNDEEIFLAIKEPWEDELIQDSTEVDLARPGIEHFFSREKGVQVTIIVNGKPEKWKKPRISFKEVVILAFGSYIDKPTTVYTVAYEDGPKQNPEGSMVKGQVVFVKNKMIFHATATDKS